MTTNDDRDNRTRQPADDTVDAAAREAASKVARARKEPASEGPIESLGRSISDVVTGADEEAAQPGAADRGSAKPGAGRA